MNRVAEPYLKVTDVVNGFAPARILHVAVGLDLFSKLTNEGKTAAQLASMLHLDPHALERLLNALTAMGFLRKEVERFYDLPISHTYLSRGGPRYIGHLIAHQTRRWADWGQLDEVLRTGKPVRAPNAQQNDPRQLDDFVRGMHELAIARGDARYLSRAIPLRRCRKLLDLGGGPGTYASMFCRANRNLQAVVFDLPGTLKVTRKILREFDRTGRVSTMSGNYRTDKIKGAPYDVVLLSNILHSEDEATNQALLTKVRDVMTPGGILIIKDHVLNPDHTQPENAAVFTINMLLETPGRCYSFAEISSWLESAEFQDMVEIPMEPPMNVSLVLALKPGQRALAVLPKPAAKVEATSSDEDVVTVDEAAHGTASDAPAARTAAATASKRGASSGNTKGNTSKPKPAAKTKARVAAKRGTQAPSRASRNSGRATGSSAKGRGAAKKRVSKPRSSGKAAAPKRS